MKPNTIAFETKARAIIAKEFVDFVGKDVVKVVRSSVYLPENDPGQWSPRSLLIATHETGIPGPADYEHDLHEKWRRIEDELSAVLGKPVFFESINQAVSALYWA